jgi:protein tyrosine phosphatase (PTP) superfamily phosphohydrolase (DUF442 family)
LALAVEAGRVLFGRNCHTVLPGRVYRCAQLSGAALERTIHTLGIRSVVNLRGCCAAFPWYLAECRATHRADVAQEDICLSASRLPSVHEVRRLVEVFDRAEYPLLVHCRRGADRTGLACAVVLLLHTDASFAQARRQLGVRYGHFPLGRRAHLDRFFDLYADWLHSQGLPHSPAAFRRWLTRDYCPGECRGTLEPLDFPARVPAGEPSALRVRVHNTGTKPWRFRPDTSAGIHVGFTLWDPAGRVRAVGRSGLFDAEVVPGKSLDLQVLLPALKQPGRYSLLVDLVDEQHGWFYQAGSEPLERDIVVVRGQESGGRGQEAGVRDQPLGTRYSVLGTRY